MAWLEKILYVDQTTPYREHAMYAGVVNTTNTPTFIVLTTTATPAEINTALTNYDVVYLEPGTYTMGTTALSVPAGKKLIGLGDWYANPAVLSWSGSPVYNHIELSNGWIENLKVYLSGIVTAVAIEGNTTYVNNYLYKINVSAATAYDFPAFYGYANEIRGMYIYNLNGIYYSGKGVSVYGVLEGIYIYNATTYGIRIVTGNNNVMIRNTTIDGNAKATDYGIYCSIDADIYRITVEDCYMYNCDNGYYFVQTGAHGDHWILELHMSRCVADSCHTGWRTEGVAVSTFTDLLALSCGESTTGCAFYFHNSAENTFKGLLSNGCPGYNFYFDTTEDSTIEGCRANDGLRGFYIDGSFNDSAMSNCCAAYCADGGADGNFIIVNANRSSFSNLASMCANSNRNYGYYIATCSNVTFNGLTDYESYYGVYVSGASVNNCIITNINLYNPGYIGFYTSHDVRSRLIISNINVYHAANMGIAIYSCYNSDFSNLFSSDSTDYGIYIHDCYYATFNGLSATNGTSPGIYLDGNYYCDFSNLVARYNRNNSNTHGVYTENLYFCNIICVNCCDNQGSGFYIRGEHSTFSDIVASYDDVYGIYGVHCAYVVISTAIVYQSGSYGVDLHSLSYSIIEGISTDGCGGLYGQYYETPLRSHFINNMAINQSAANNYGFYYLNNGTGYNQLFACSTYNDTAEWPSGGGYGNWFIDHCLTMD